MVTQPKNMNMAKRIKQTLFAAVALLGAGVTLEATQITDSNTQAARTIASGSCATLTFTFMHNVSTNPALYTGTATFSPWGTITTLP